MGDKAAEWINKLLGHSWRLLRICRHRYPYEDVRMCHLGEKDSHRLNCQDMSHFHLITESSYADLLTTLPAEKRASCQRDRFRANIVVKGSPAYDEDKWEEV